MATKTKRRVQRNHQQRAAHRTARPSVYRRDELDDEHPRRAAGGGRKVKGTRRDGFANEYSGIGTDRDRRTKTTYNSIVVDDLYGLELLRSDDIMERIAALLPREALRRGVNVKVSADENGKETAEKMHDDCERLSLVERVRHARVIERACGGSAIFPVFDGAVGDLEEDLADYEDSIVGIKALHILEPRELQPVQWYTDITHPKFRKPMKYRLQALSGATGKPLSPVIIHESRLVIFGGIRVSNQVRSGQRPGWGDSVYNKCFEVVADFGIGWGSAATIIHDFAHGVYKLADLDKILARKDGEQELQRRLSSMDQLRSALRAAIIAKDDEYSRVTTSVSGLADLLVQLAQRLAASADMPVTLLMGMSPAGMNATGESDIRGWYDRVEAERAYLREKVEQLLRWLWLSGDGPTEGVEPEQWSIEWPPLWQPSEVEVANVRKTIADTDNIYFNMGFPALKIFESRWKGDTFSGEMSNIDWADLEKQAELDKEQAAALSQQDITAMGRAPGDDAQPGDPADDGEEHAAGDGKKAAPAAQPAMAPGRKVPVQSHERTIPAKRTDGRLAEGTSVVVTRGDALGELAEIIDDYGSHVAVELASGECVALERGNVTPLEENMTTRAGAKVQVTRGDAAGCYGEVDYDVAGYTKVKLYRGDSVIVPSVSLTRLDYDPDQERDEGGRFSGPGGGGGGGGHLSHDDHRTLSVLASEKADDQSVPMRERDHHFEVADRLHSGKATSEDYHHAAKLADADADLQRDPKTAQRYRDLAARARNAAGPSTPHATATHEAKQATARALASGSAADHEAAAQAHSKAGTANRMAGEYDTASRHSDIAREHNIEAETLATKNGQLLSSDHQKLAMLAAEKADNRRLSADKREHFAGVADRILAGKGTHEDHHAVADLAEKDAKKQRDPKTAQRYKDLAMRARRAGQTSDELHAEATKLHNAGRREEATSVRNIAARKAFTERDAASKVAAEQHPDNSHAVSGAAKAAHEKTRAAMVATREALMPDVHTAADHRAAAKLHDEARQAHSDSDIRNAHSDAAENHREAARRIDRGNGDGDGMADVTGGARGGAERAMTLSGKKK